MRKNLPLSQEQKDEILRLFTEGIPRAEIAKRLSISRPTVFRYTPVATKSTSEELNKRNESIKKLYRDGIPRKDIEKHLGVSKTIIQRALQGEPRLKIQREWVKKEKVIPKVAKKEKSLHPEIKRLWMQGKTMSIIARELNIGFPRVKQSIIDMGIEDIERSVFSKPKLKTIDRHTNRTKVQINHKTWAYMDSEKWDCENKFREFKIKQLGL